MPTIAELRYGIMILPQLYDELFSDKKGCERMESGDSFIRLVCKDNDLKLFVPPGENRERIVSLERSQPVRAENDSRYFSFNETDERVVSIITNTKINVEKFIDALTEFYAKKSKKTAKIARPIVIYNMSSVSWILTAYVE